MLVIVPATFNLPQMLGRAGLSGRRMASTVARNPSFVLLSDADLTAFERIVGAENVKTADLEDYNRDWTKWYQGGSQCAVLPSSTEEVSALLSHCAHRRLAVVPQAGNTGMVGGSTPVHDEVVLSIKRIRNHFEFDPVSGVLDCDAGFILEELDTKLAEYGYMMPLDLGAKGSCLLGGNVSTCAGGIRLLRYGSLHAHLLGLTAVLPDNDGTILECGSRLRKDNTSLHLPHFFLGSEGQLGVITRVAMTTVPRPRSVHSFMLGADSFEDCRGILRLAREGLGEILSSFEFMDEGVMGCLKENLQLKSVLSLEVPFTLLVETSGSNEEHDRAKVEAFLDQCLGDGLAVDGIMANSAKEASQMWQLRESAPLAVARDGWVYKHDVSLPLQHFYTLSGEMKKRCDGLAKRVVTYGHLGDGNSHLNITSDKFDQELYDRLYPNIYEWVVRHGGSISAEHGIGRLKLLFSNLGKSPAERALVRRVKSVFDPYGILNPYKTLPE